MSASTDDLIDLALAVARNTGWPVFPCGADKKPAIAKNDGGQGLHDATTNPAEICRIFDHPRSALIGIRTGEASGIDVLDVDTKHAAAIQWLGKAQRHIPSSRTYQTQSGGFHVYFRHSPGVRNTQGRIHTGIDTRGDGGYVVYWFGVGLPCTDQSPPADWPSWLLETLFYEPKPEPVPARGRRFRSNGGTIQNRIAGIIRTVETASDGLRHETLRNCALALGGLQAEAGLSAGDATRLLFDAILAAGGARVDQSNALATIKWGLENGAARPLPVAANG